MGIQNFTVSFNNPRGEYYSGDELKICVQFFVDSPIKIRSLKCNVMGIATTRWEQQIFNTTYIYEGAETYFNNSVILLQKTTSQDLHLGPGEYKYALCFDVPENIPPTYSGKKGEIEYYVSAVIDRAWKTNKTTSSLFVVKQLLDLNRDALVNPNIREPAVVQLEESFCCCWNHGTITATVKLPYRAFTRRQVVPLGIEIENSSNVHVNGLHYNIVQIDTFFTSCRGHKTKKEVSLISGRINRNVQPRTSTDFVCNLQMPDIPFVNLRHCQVIDVDYILKFELDLSSGLAYNVDFPITFGTVPLENFVSVPLIDPPLYEAIV